jgi:hypothetical protein
VTALNQMGIGVESGIGVDVSHNILENCRRGIDFEGSSTRPVQGVSAAFNSMWNCDIGVRFGGTTGPNTGTVGPNWMGGTRSFRYAFDAGWAVHSAGEWDTSAMFGSFA